MTQLSLLDHAESRRLRDEAISRVSANHPTLVQRLRAEAIRVARERGGAHADDLRAFAEREGLVVPSKVWGAVWSHPSWVKIGERASAHPACHAHKSGVYVWRGE